jgi:hypothetical protein
VRSRDCPRAGNKVLLIQVITYDLFRFTAGSFQVVVHNDMVEPVFKRKFKRGFVQPGFERFRVWYPFSSAAAQFLIEAFYE